MKTCTFLIQIVKEGAQSLRMKMRNAELYLKEATVIYGFHPARNSVKVRKTRLLALVQLRTQEQAFN